MVKNTLVNVTCKFSLLSKYITHTVNKTLLCVYNSVHWKGTLQAAFNSYWSSILTRFIFQKSKLFIYTSITRFLNTIEITHVFLCINICWFARKQFEHEAYETNICDFCIVYHIPTKFL